MLKRTGRRPIAQGKRKGNQPLAPKRIAERKGVARFELLMAFRESGQRNILIDYSLLFRVTDLGLGLGCHPDSQGERFFRGRYLL